MTRPAAPTWLPALIARTPVVQPERPRAAGGRHAASEQPSAVLIAAPEDLARAGRHTESEWGRELHDPRRDELDAFEWLGFGQG